MTTQKEKMAERLRVAQDYGTAEEIADAQALFAAAQELERKDAARQSVGLVPTLAQLAERIDVKRAAAAAPQSRTKKGAGL